MLNKNSVLPEEANRSAIANHIIVRRPLDEAIEAGDPLEKRVGNT